MEWINLRMDLGRREIGTKNPFNLPQRLWQFLLQQAGIPLNTKWADLKSANQQQLIQLLTRTNLQVKGVKFLTDNKTPNKVKPIEQIRVCFTVDRNKLISTGEKEFFVQVVNPKNDIVSVEELTFENNNITLKYSKLVKFEYQQQITDVCSYVDLEKNKSMPWPESILKVLR